MALSPRGRYKKGARLEYKTMRFYEAGGYDCYRMAGSHSPFDVIAINDHHIVLAQVKGGNASMTPLEKEKAEMARGPANALKVEVRWPDRARLPIIKEIK